VHSDTLILYKNLSGLRPEDGLMKKDETCRRYDYLIIF
jgi:hypothetical protein